MFKRYQKLMVKNTFIFGSNPIEVYYYADYIGYERDFNNILIPQTKLIVTTEYKGKIYHISPMDIVEVIDGID